MTTWMDLQVTMLSEISQRQILYDFSYVWNLKKTHTKQNKKQKQAQWYIEQAEVCQRGEEYEDGWN